MPVSTPRHRPSAPCSSRRMRPAPERLRRLRTGAVALTAVLALGAAACGGSSGGSSGNGGSAAASASPTRGGDLVIARTADSQSMNKTTVFQNESIWVFEQIYETLYTVTPDGKDVKPLLATSYTVSPDKLTYTFKLRQGVTFSTGKALTAADVKFSIDAATAAKEGWGYINAAIKDTKAPAADTFVVDLKYPWAPLVADLSLFSNGIVPANYGGEKEAAFYEHPVGTGPFKWSSWEKGKSLKLVRNDTYWQTGKPYLDSVTWTDVGDSNTRNLQLKGGQADIDEFPAWSTVAQLKATPDVRLDLFPSTRTDYLAFNHTRKPFGDSHVRRAISYALDRESLNKAVLFGNGTTANSFLAPTTPFYAKDTKALSFDLDAAKKEMAASTVPTGFPTTILVPSGEADSLTLAQIVQAALKPLGIIVTVTQLDANVVNTRQQALDYDMVFTAWTMDISDPDELTTFAVDPKAGSKSFFTGYSNPAVVAANTAAAKTLDQATRQQLYTKIQSLAAEDAFIAPLYYSPYAYGSSTKVQGFAVTPLGNYHLEDVWKTGS